MIIDGLLAKTGCSAISHFGLESTYALDYRLLFLHCDQIKTNDVRAAP